MKYIIAACLLFASWSFVAAQQPGESEQEALTVPIPILVNALNHQDQRIRVRAVNVLVSHGNNAVPALTERLLHGDLLPATSAAVVLGRMGDAAVSATPRLVEILKDAQAEEWRWFMAGFLLHRVDPAAEREALPLFVSALGRPEPMRQLAALNAVMTIEGDTSSAAAALTALLHRKREPLTGVAISERVLIDNQVAYTQAVPAYDDLFILSAMHKAGVPEAELLPVLREKTTHDSPSVRLIAARRMSELGPEARRVAAGTLVSLLTETRVDIQEQAVSILSKLGADASGSVAALTELLANGNSPVRQAAARALGEIGPPAKSAAPALQQAIQFEKLMGTGGQDVMVEALEKLVGPPAPKA